MPVLLAGLLIPLVLVQPADVKSPKFSAALVPAAAAIQPGGTLDLAIALDIEKPWHIYYPILLDTGYATTVDFALPDGLAVDEIRFPTPKLETVLEAELLALDGKPVLMTRLTAAKTVQSGATLEIRAEIKALACIEACVPVEAVASLRLPVSAEPAAAANEDMIKKARGALPPLLASAPYLKGSRVAASHAKVPIKGRGELVAFIKVQPGHHIQAADPGVEELIPSRLFIEPLDGIELGEPVWPKARTREIKGLGTVNELSGEFAVRVPFTVSDDKFEPRLVRLRALLSYQACTDAGQCFAPEMAEGAFEFEVVAAGRESVKVDDPAFAALPPLPSSAARGSKASSAKMSAAAAATPPLDAKSIFFVFLFAFLGGVILNVMPCVLPVISLKIFSFMQQAGDGPERVLRMGLVYALGILASFLALAVVMVWFGVAWGGWMQEPSFLIVLMALVLAFSLSLMGVFELRLPGMIENVAGAATTREGYGGAFLNGIMATALATPCTAPFLGSAVGLLVKLPPVIAGAGIMTVGVGLAAPYVLLTAFPGWLRFLPKPGPWMITFKQFMGFVLMATLIWLMWVLQYLVESSTLVASVTLMLGVGLACWFLGRIELNTSAPKALALWSAGGASLLLAWYVGFVWLGGAAGLSAPLTQTSDAPNARDAASADGAADGDHIRWRAWRPGLDSELAEQGYTVYVDFTAKWCLTCQANKRLVLETDAVRKRLRELNVVMLTADFTRKNPEIQEELKKYGRAGVPLNLVFPAEKPSEPIALPETLTQGIVFAALDKAGPSKTKPAVAVKNAE
ncbi:MAG: protein-disulfide reductase DsbD family protein [Phycisphaerae bacterium]